jgi:ABC-type multidrug transport system fused ATPase/permease subunit
MRNFFNKVFYILGEKKKSYFHCIFLYSSSSILDLAVLSLLPFLIASFTGGEAKNDLFINKYIAKDHLSIYYVGSAILLITFLKSFINYKSIYKIVNFVSRVQKVNREKIFSFYKDIFINDFLSSRFEKYLNITSYIVGVFSENILFKSITVISEIIIILIIFFYLSFINIYALAGLVIFFVSLLGTYFFLIRKFISTAGKKQSNSSEMLTSIIHNVFKGLKEIKTLNLNNFFDKKFEYYNDQYTSNFISYQRLVFLPKYMLESVMICFVILLFFFVSFLSNSSINNYFELIGIFLFASFRITPLAYNIFSSLSQIYSSAYAMEEIYNEFEKINSYRKKQISIINKNIQFSLISKFDSLRLENIYFGYSEDKKKYILKNINFLINKGDCIGIKGDSGSGKTTLINILLGLIYPSKGNIIVNNAIDARSSNIFEKMSYTPQDFFLMNGSIIENIALGAHPDNINYNKIFDILKITQLDKSFDVNSSNFIDILSERNIDTLSGGQAQRIAISRNFYFSREINVFDEFTSALDSKTEDNIIEFLNTIKGRNTIIIVSHRLNALKFCDKIYAIENGSLVQKN